MSSINNIILLSSKSSVHLPTPSSAVHFQKNQVTCKQPKQPKKSEKLTRSVLTSKGPGRTKLSLKLFFSSFELAILSFRLVSHVSMEMELSTVPSMVNYNHIKNLEKNLIKREFGYVPKVISPVSSIA